MRIQPIQIQKPGQKTSGYSLTKWHKYSQYQNNDILTVHCNSPYTSVLWDNFWLTPGLNMNLSGHKLRLETISKINGPNSGEWVACDDPFLTLWELSIRDIPGLPLSTCRWTFCHHTLDGTEAWQSEGWCWRSPGWTERLEVLQKEKHTWEVEIFLVQSTEAQAGSVSAQKIPL